MKKLLYSLLVLFGYLFLYAPLVVLITYSFNSKGFPSNWDSFTLKWYKELFHSKELWNSFFISLLVATLATTLSLSLALLLIFFKDLGGKIQKMVPLFYTNLIIPETLLGISLLSYFTIFNVPLGISTLVIAHTVLGLGLAIPVLFIKYKEIDPRLKEASMNLGASEITSFFKITFPSLKISMIAVGLLIFILSFDDFVLSFFCAGTHIQTISLYLLSLIRTGISPVVNALSGILLLLSVSLVAIFCSPKIRSKFSL